MMGDLSDWGLLLLVLAGWASRETIHQWGNRQRRRLHRALGIHRSYNAHDWKKRDSR